VSLPMDGLTLDVPTGPSTPDFSATNTMSVEPTTLSDPLKDSGMLEFDMGSLSLDLEPSTASDLLTAAPDTTGEDPLETKLALAEEFVSIGDEDGARALIEEVVAEATGDMRAKAQRALANLS
jgi:pilus assembly protein FimV